ncbi:MAG: hypothetical protein FD181_1067 [Prolixibacteraceae bacterium]|nr:MAG: hypothetical protein FD181_1067 [Prolixibacteraceae bacterium]
MRIWSPLFILFRILIYALLVFGIAEGIFFDAANPVGDSYFGEITFTEIGQETIFFILFVFYLILGYRWREIQPISNLVSLFFLMSFIREFNFLVDKWIYPVLVVVAFFVWLFIRDFNKIKEATIRFFSVPASAWLLSGFLVTFIFSRLMGRSKFWKLMYSDESYRLAKAATEEGIELLGNTIMLIGVIEFLIYYFAVRKIENEKL